MELRLTLTGPERFLGGRTVASLREGALLIGRSQEADWAIPDPDKIISKVHCRVDKDAGGFQVTDLSTNGVRVNDTPVGHGLARRVEHGDEIKLGDAVLSVAIAASEPASVPAESVFIADGPFSEGAAEPGIAAPASPAPPQAEPEATGMVLDDWWRPNDDGEAGAPANPVDISPRSAPAANVHIQPEEDSLLSHDRGVAHLLRVVAGLDMEEFVRAVDAAAAVLSPGEQVKFRERLSEILRNASGR